jgi:hypothetical protein
MVSGWSTPSTSFTIGQHVFEHCHCTRGVTGHSKPPRELVASGQSVGVIDAEYPFTIGQHLFEHGHRTRGVACLAAPLRVIVTCGERVRMVSTQDSLAVDDQQFERCGRAYGIARFAKPSGEFMTSGQGVWVISTQYPTKNRCSSGLEHLPRRRGTRATFSCPRTELLSIPTP